MSRRMMSITVAGLVLVTTLAACSRDGDGEEADELTYEDSPLGQYFGAGEEFDEDAWAEQQMQVEEAVAACMAAEGFEYIPVDQSGGIVYSDDDMENQDTEEWVSQYGYGINSYPGMDATEEPVPEEEYVDPNGEYVESLSPSEQEAYYATLYGEPPAEEDLAEDGSYEYNWETAGCYGAAEHEINGDASMESEEFEPLMTAIQEFYENLENDPALADLNAEWASCMADAGQPGLDSPNDAIDQVIEESNALWEDGTEPDQAALDAAKESEITIALADFHCQNDIDYQDRMLAVQFELEEQFIEDHRAELDAYLAAQEQGA